ncbi:hypothetical protein ACFE04_031001 [Oxalis oulophora]
MKTKLRAGSLREKNGVRVCQKSSVITKKACSVVKISQAAELDTCILNGHEIPSSIEVTTEDIGNIIGTGESLSEENSQAHIQSSRLDDSSAIERTEFSVTCESNLDTIFSLVVEPVAILSEHTNKGDSGNRSDPVVVPILGTNDRGDNLTSSDYQTCAVSDFNISDMIITGLPYDESQFDTELSVINQFSDYKYREPSMLYDVAEQCMVMPFLEDNTVKTSTNTNDSRSHEAIADPYSTSLYEAISQLKPCDQQSDVISDSDPAEEFDPESFIKNLPELSDVVSNFCPTVLPVESWKRKTMTLVLDLDETLVHSRLEPCHDVDFTFTVFFNMKDQTVYVKKRPYLHMFLERVAEMFEVVIFTASQSIYAEKLLNILDPEGKFISRRFYRESCIFPDGCCTKDLSLLGFDLTKVAIIDNSPQVFRYQKNNGIPIKSWYDDPTDYALLSMLPFLETLVEADDVRPIIAKKFSN